MEYRRMKVQQVEIGATGKDATSFDDASLKFIISHTSR
jgi:hypothetical protein